MDISDTQLVEKKLELLGMQRFGEYVGWLIMGRDVGSLDGASLNFFPYNMTIDVSVFCTFMKDRIRCYMKGCFVVAMKGGWRWVVNVEIFEERL